MPPRRQLPWATKSGNRTAVKQAPKPRPIPSDVDDDFFDGTVLGSSSRDKRRDVADESDGDLPGLPTKFLRTITDNNPECGSQMQSSSPPPIIEDLPPLKTEYMRKGVNKFDLRDDEWMMVEDELLQTAKLFTQHLHLAEYETLKTKIEEQRKASTERPIVANVKPSSEGRFKRKAEEQIKGQKKAVKNLLTSLDAQTSGENKRVQERKTPSYSGPPKSARSTFTKSMETSNKVVHLDASDSDDLDAPKRPKPKPSGVAPKPVQEESTTTETQISVKPEKPHIARRKAARTARPDLWDEWDDFAPKSQAQIDDPSLLKKPQQESSPTKPSHTCTTSRNDKTLPTPSKRVMIDLESDLFSTPRRNSPIKSSSTSNSKNQSDEDQDQTSSTKFDDIPTFLF